MPALENLVPALVAEIEDLEVLPAIPRLHGNAELVPGASRLDVFNSPILTARRDKHWLTGTQTSAHFSDETTNFFVEQN